MSAKRHGSLRRNDRVEARRVGGRVVLVNLEDNWIHELNETGARVWELIEEGLGESEIPARLAKEFDVPAGTDLGAEVDAVVDELLAAGLLTR